MSAIKTLQELLLSYSPFGVTGVPVCNFLNQQLMRYILNHSHACNLRSIMLIILCLS